MRDVASLATMVKKLSGPRVVWIMVPAGAPTRDTVATVSYTHLDVYKRQGCGSVVPVNRLGELPTCLLYTSRCV